MSPLKSGRDMGVFQEYYCTMSTEATPQFLLIDLFCGAGGTTTAAEMSGVVKVIAAINHDPLAIASHRENHPHVLHVTDDILMADITPLQECVAHWRKHYPHARLILWASLECTNFSDAKGGLPRDADSRALADGMFRYLHALNPDYFHVENVEDFMSWGPLMPKVVKSSTGDYCPLHYKAGHPGPHLIPESRRAGKDYIRWVKTIQSMGYRHDWRLLTSADYGGVTIRERLFIAFWKTNMPFSWPIPTHARNVKPGALFQNNLKPWRPVSEVLDFYDLGKSIFDRPRPLVDKSLRRILDGLRKFHHEPLLMTYNSPGYSLPVSRPSGTLTTACSKALVTPIPMLSSYYGNGRCTGTDQPAPTVTTRDRMAMVTPFVFSYYTRESSVRSVQSPDPTVACQDRIGIVQAKWIDRDFRTGRNSSIHAPIGAILTRPKANLCSAFIVNPQYGNTGNSVNKPAPTVIAKQKSFPLSLATTFSGLDPKWHQKPGDSAVMIELKAFMHEHGIADIYMRMLNVRELKLIQGFPANYVLKGTSEQQKKFIGNSVERHVAVAQFQAIANS